MPGGSGELTENPTLQGLPATPGAWAKRKRLKSLQPTRADSMTELSPDTELAASLATKKEHWVWLAQLVQDVRFGSRTLRRNPGFTSTVILTLALAIGMNTGVFSVIEAVILRPLPYPDANRLIFLSSYSTDELTEHDTLVSRIDYLNWKDQTGTTESTAAYGNQDLAITYRGQTTQERIASISGNFWEPRITAAITR
jgi:hypothetical protein